MAGQRDMSGRKRTSSRETPIMSGLAGCPTPKKTGYFTRSDAKRAAKQIAQNGNHVQAKPVPYACVCGLFHVGNMLRHKMREQMPHSAMRT